MNAVATSEPSTSSRWYERNGDSLEPDIERRVNSITNVSFHIWSSATEHVYELTHYAAPFVFSRPSLHLFKACVASSTGSLHRSFITPQVRDRTMVSTALSCRKSIASCSVRGSLVGYLPEYGSNRSSTPRSRILIVSFSLKDNSGSSGSGLVAT